MQGKNILSFWLCCLSLDSLAQDPPYPTAPAAPQNILQAEYFIDTDPGFGNGTAISITAAVDINSLVATISTTGLSNGVHRLFVRSKSNEGNWSISNSQEFIVDFNPAYSTVPVPQNIVQAEYFIDTDPGFGNGSAISITPAVDISNLIASINTTGLSIGSHRLFVRSRSNEGHWAITNAKEFVIEFNPPYSTPPAAPQNIMQAEYFFDTDPGFGNGTAISITAAADISNLITSINTTGLSIGSHRLFVRSRSNEGHWSITNYTEFIVSEDYSYPPAPAAPGNITYAEYFFDTDPGFGNGTLITLTPGVDISNLTVTVNTSALPDGNHKLFVRSYYDWSLTYYQSFVKGVPLPLHFLSFSAVGNRNDVLLTWTTDNEINTSHFDIEFSKDGVSFLKLGEVSAMNTVGVHGYNFTHLSPTSTVLYYRIKQVDLDGRFEYSKVARVNMKKSMHVILYPNPAAGIIKITGLNASEIKEVQVIDAGGKTVLRYLPSVQMEYDVHKLLAGAYTVRIIKTNQAFETIQFIKK